MEEAKVVTASSVISFVERLEDNSSAFYEELAERYDEGTETFLDFAKGGQKNKKSIVRTYRETVSDALETGFSFQGLDLREYTIDADLPEDASLEEALNQALTLEEQAVAFYKDVAKRSRALLATIPMAFRSAAKRRQKRKAKLEALRDSGSGA